MGSGVSTSRDKLRAFTESKPDDASDIEDLDLAKQEIIQFRNFAKLLLANEKKDHFEDFPRTRAGVVDRQPAFKYKVDSTYVPKVIPKPDAVRALLKEAVSKNILFASYSDEEQNAIIDAKEAIHVTAGEYVIRQHDNGDDFYIVESGTLEIYVKTAHGESKVGVYLTPGSAFGELALMYDAPRAASVKAATDCVLWYIHRNVYREIIIYYKYQRSKTYIEFLRNVEVLGKRLGSCLTTDELEKLAITMDKEVFNANDVIIRQGNVGNNFYILIHGEVDVYKSNEFNKRGSTRADAIGVEEYRDTIMYTKVATVQRGNYFGEIALIREDVRQASCVARTPVTCLTLGREDFIQMMGRLEDIAETDKPIKIPAESKFEVLTDLSGRCSKSCTDHGPQYMTQDSIDGSPAPTIALNSNISRELDVSPVENDQSSTSSLYKLDKITFGRTLGKGTFGQVMHCVHKTSAETFAIKCQSKKAIVDSHTEDLVMNEYIIMQKISHPYIARLYAAMQDEHSLYFLMELLPGGELFTYLQDVNMLAEVDARFYAAAMVSAFKLLHAPHMRIAYRDLKPENIVLARNGLPKLVDFGLAKQIITGKTYTMCGTPDYLAPEIILNLGHNHAVDYWTLGIFISELVSGQTPFAAHSTMEVYSKILNDTPRLPSTLSRSVTDLIFKLLKPQQGKRLGNTKDGMTAIISHKWFNSFNWKKLEICELTAPFIPKLKKKDDLNFPDFDEGECYSPSPCSWVVPLVSK